MGLRIGDTAAAYSARPAAGGQRNTARPAGTPEENPRPQAGFGENTTSPASVALESIGQTVRSVQDVVPSVEDLRQQFSERFEARVAGQDNVSRQETGEQTGIGGAPVAERAPEAFRPQASSQVRAFIETNAQTPPRGDQGTPVPQFGTPPENGTLDVLA